MPAPEVHIHPEGQVYVRAADGTNYGDLPANLLVDVGVALPPLPAGVVEQIYTQGRRHAFHDADGNVVGGGPMPWPAGDALIAMLPTLLAKKTARETALEAAKAAADLAEMQAVASAHLAQALPFEQTDFGKLQATVDSQAALIRELQAQIAALQAGKP